MAKIYEIIARHQKSIDNLDKKAGQSLEFDGSNLLLKNGTDETLSDIDLTSLHNQNAFSSVASSGNDTIEAGNPTSTLNIEASAGIQITTDKSNNQINIIGPDIMYKLL